MTTLSEFHTLVSDALGRSTSLDSTIAQRVKMAARWLERNYTFQYMRQIRTFDVDPDATYPYVLSLSGLEVKQVDLLRRRAADAAGTGYVYSRPLKQVEFRDRETRSVGLAESYALNGVSSIYLNSIPDEAETYETNLVLYTDWGTASDWEHWLLEDATNLLLARTLMMMCIRSRDPDLYAMYKSEFDLEIKSFNVAEEELQSSEVVPRWEPPEGVSNETYLRDG